jgi:chromosome segregation ATPase
MEFIIFTKKHLQLIILPILLLLVFSGCSTANQGTVSQLDTNSRADQTFSFYKDEGGKDIRWEVNFSKGEISSIFKDGERIPDNEIDDYRGMIYKRINNLQSKSHHIEADIKGFKFDMKNFKEDIHKMKEGLKNRKFEFHFDEEAFKDGMKELSAELSKLKDKKIKIEFDSDRFDDEMDRLSKDINIQVNVNMDDLKENIEKMKTEMRDHMDEIQNIDIDLSGLDDAMSELGKNMGSIKIKLHGLDIKLKKLNDFIDAIKEEMVKDNLIKSEDEKLNLDLDDNGMEVNGKKVSNELYEKYKKMYEEHFDKKLSDDDHFRIIN